MMAQQQLQEVTAPAPLTATTTAAFVGKRRATTTAVHCLVSSYAALLLLVLLSWAPQVASGASSSSYLGLCIAEAQACLLDEVCQDCLGTWSADNVDDTCVADFVEVQSVSSGDCGTGGVETCCGFVAGTSDTCMENAPMVEYWACIQSGNGCDLTDIPCYGTEENEIQAAGNGAAAGKMSSSGLPLASAIAAAACAAAALV